MRNANNLRYEAHCIRDQYQSRPGHQQPRPGWALHSGLIAVRARRAETDRTMDYPLVTVTTDITPHFAWLSRGARSPHVTRWTI